MALLKAEAAFIAQQHAASAADKQRVAADRERARVAEAARVASERASSSQQAAPTGQPEKKAPRWQEHKTAEGQVFYFDSETQVSQWTRPPEMDADAPSANAAPNVGSQQAGDAKQKADDERARLRAEVEAEERQLEARRVRLREEAEELAAEQARLAAEKSARAAVRPVGGVAVMPAPGAPRGQPAGVPQLPVRRGNAGAGPTRQPMPAPARAAASPSLPSREAEELARMREENARLKRENEELSRRKRESVALTIGDGELYELVEIGQGAFGVMYVAKRNHERVAVKTVNNAAFGSDADIRNEVAVLQKLKPHSNIVSYRGFANVRGQPALVLEYCEGGSLWAALEKARDAEWPKERQLKVASGIAAGVAYLHDNDIVHRDLAARNVLLTGDSVARVTDFGMSIKSEALETSSAVGAVAWMAPEQLNKDASGKFSSSKKSDVYSFGVVLFELFERKVPWGDCKTLVETFAKLRSGETLPIDEDKYPDGILAIVETCWDAPSMRPDMKMVAGLLGKAYDRAVKKQSTRGGAPSKQVVRNAPPGYFNSGVPGVDDRGPPGYFDSGAEQNDDDDDDDRAAANYFDARNHAVDNDDDDDDDD